MMTTFYEKGPVRITERRLQVHGRSYPVEALHRLEVARGPIELRLGPRTLTFVVASALVCVLVTFCAPGLAIAVAVAAASAVVAVVVVARRRRTYQLWARYHGRPVRLYQTTDRNEFGKVSRALLRAANDHRARPCFVVRLSQQQAPQPLPQAGEGPTRWMP